MAVWSRSGPSTPTSAANLPGRCSPDGALLAIAAANPTDDDPSGDTLQGSVSIVDRTGKEVDVVRDEGTFVNIISIAFTSDGERLVGARSPIEGWDDWWGEVAIWDWRAGGPPERSFDTDGEEAVLSPRGDLLVSTPPAIARITNPAATTPRSTTGSCFNHALYVSVSTTYPATTAASSPFWTGIATTMPSTTRITAMTFARRSLM